MNMIIPGILEQDWSAIEEKIELVRPFAKTIHIDLIDGTFAENTSFMDPAPFAKYKGEIDFELHMMVEDPLQYVKSFAAVGFTRFLGHIEMMPNQAEFVSETQFFGEVGLVIDAHTLLSDILVSFEDLDSLLVMTVKAGYSGQEMLPGALHKVASAMKKHPLLTVEVDGGVTSETLTLAYQAGARRFVATSAIFGAPDPEAAYSELSETVAKMVEASVLPE